MIEKRWKWPEFWKGIRIPFWVLACIASGLAIGAGHGCETIRGAAGQNTFATFDAEGNLEISGDGTADFDVVAKGDDNGWSLTLKTKTSRDAVQGATGVALEGFRAINALAARISSPGVVGPPAPVPVARSPPAGDSSGTIPDP